MKSIVTLLDRLAAHQVRRALAFVLAGLLLGALSVPLVAQLGLKSAWEALLPRDKTSVLDLERIRGRVGGLSTLTVAIESQDLSAMQRMASALVPRLDDLPDELVRSVDWNVTDYRDFAHDNRHLYAPLDELEALRDSLAARLEHERLRANPFYVPLDDGPPPDPMVDVRRLRASAAEGEARMDRHPGGFYVHPDHDLLVVFVRSDLRGGDAAGVGRLLAAVQAEVDALGPTSYAPDLRVSYGGNLVVAGEEHQAIKNELVTATALTLVLVLAVILLFFRKLRVLPLLGVGLFIPVLMTFAFAELTVDYLNTSTAFLGSIILGNGINPNIIWLARYFEERRAGRDVAEAVARTHRGVWLATLTASLAAAVAYGSLIVTDFRGFRDFGIIGFAGMVLCWAGAMALLPAAVALSERLRPMRLSTTAKAKNIYGRAFAALAFRAPRSIVALSVVLALVSLFLVTRAVAADPLEYDFRRLKSAREGGSVARQINRRVMDITRSTDGGNSIAVVLDDRAQVLPLEQELEARSREAGEDRLWADARTVFDLLPEEQEEKLPILAELRELAVQYEPHLDERQLAELREHVPPAELVALTPESLPASVARSLTERDGTRGRILLVRKRRGRSVWDGRYLMEWAAALRALRLPDGTRPSLAGNAPVFADIIEVIVTDGPRTILVSFVATLLLVVLTFRVVRERMLIMMSLLLGILWMAGTMALVGMKLNFLNFVAFPITFGNGVDYGVNVMRRYSQENADDEGPADSGAERAAVRAAVEESGGAVVVCSLTTIIGYSSLYASANQALNSFGLAMAISEITCLLAAVLTMPAVLLLMARRARGRVTTPQPEPTA